MYHEELESLSTHFPEIERARFWMTFGDAYIMHATVLQTAVSYNLLTLRTRELV